MTFKIEKGVAIPKVAVKTKWPFAQMEVGDSFAVKPGEEKLQCVSGASSYGRRHGKKFSVLRQDDGNYRCWRIE